ncbi:glycosyltransferase family 4 protein [Candidatus Avelusimicrobium fimicolum]|jgi:glycosyltransferase involved in cell wall biosynthesis|uniref:glycosyltransferase family 4 protein n=1 Tax=Candidatus Avelusimicrobium fimicolum TaxID=3416216 RepID=UPI003D0F3BDE
MEKTKILYFITRMDQGGAQASVLTTLKTLNKQQFETYLATGPGGRLDFKLKNDAGRVFFISALRHDIRPRYIFHDIWAVWQMGRVLRQVRPDIVHTNAPKAGVLGRIAARLFWRKAKVVHTFHGLGFAKEHGSRQFKFFVAVEKFCSRFTNVLVFVSRRNAAEAKQLGIGKGVRTELIRAGINFNPILPLKFDPAAKKASFKIPANAKVVLALANFKPLKNPIHFVLAAYKVLSQMKNVYFIFTGEGPLKQTAENLAKNLGIEKQVLFPGWRSDALELLAISDVYASVSLREGLPMSLLEAMAMRVPAVCYDVDGIGEVITNNKTGFLVKPNDINTFADKLKVLLRHAALRERFEAAIDHRDFAEFTASTMVKKQEHLYRSLVPPTKKNGGKRRFFRRRYRKPSKNFNQGDK